MEELKKLYKALGKAINKKDLELIASYLDDMSAETHAIMCEKGIEK